MGEDMDPKEAGIDVMKKNQSSDLLKEKMRFYLIYQNKEPKK